MTTSGNSTPEAQPTPEARPMRQCPHCGAMNDPARGSNRCRNCQLPMDMS
jgi:hypothetical protein